MIISLCFPELSLQQELVDTTNWPIEWSNIEANLYKHEIKGANFFAAFFDKFADSHGQID
jgi:hypothetical protein